MATVAPKSAITPSRSGWITSTSTGSFPASASAGSPTAATRHVAPSTATAEGSSTTGMTERGGGHGLLTGCSATALGCRWRGPGTPRR